MKAKCIEVELGPVPAEEECAQVGSPDYRVQSRIEATVFIRYLQRVFGSPDPQALSFVRRGYAHELGRYHEIVVVIGPAGAALFGEVLVPTTWDHIARAELLWLRLRERWLAYVHDIGGAIELVPDVFLDADIPSFPDHPVASWWAMGFCPMPAGCPIAYH